MHKFRAGSNNLFTFAKAFPMVERLPDGSIKDIGDVTRSNFELRPKITSNFGTCKKEVQIKFDILTKELLTYVAQHGSRVLHLTSDIVDHNSLTLEGKNGICTKISKNDLYQLFSNQSTKLSIDVVVIAIPDSTNIAETFEVLGVPHVLAFDY